MRGRCTHDEIRARTVGRPRLWADRALSDKGYPSNATGPGCGSGRSPRRSPARRQHYRGRNVVERCFNRLKQWHGLVMRSDKTVCNHRSLPGGTLRGLKTGFVNTA